MSAYLLAQIQVNDSTTYAEYVKGFMPILQKYDGFIVTVKDQVEVLEGTWNYPRTVILKFPTREKALEWYHSDEYTELMKFRLASAKANVVLL